MSVRKKRKELRRLQGIFESEASRFQDLTLSILYLSNMAPPKIRSFSEDNHIIMLWQFFGFLDTPERLTRVLATTTREDLDIIGMPRSEFSCYALMEGKLTQRFIRMAERAGSVFSEKEIKKIKSFNSNNFRSNERFEVAAKESKAKQVFVENDAKLAVWLNFVLHHLGITHSRLMPEVRVPLDPFAASLAAIDSLLETGSIDEKTSTRGKINDIRFKVALSFPGERRDYVERVAGHLQGRLGDHAVFYDHYYEADLVRPNLDLLLQEIYHDNSELVVVFLCDAYARKEWCGLEWRAIRDLIKKTENERIMIIRFDETEIPGVFGIDGYLSADTLSPEEVAGAILRRLESSQ